MKRYLITITGRANLGYKGNKLRERDLCCSYVYGKNKAEAISKFWEQIEKSSGLKGFERRDFKITAERWEKEADLDVNGNVLTDIEWAIPFDLLASVEMMHDEHFKNYKLAVPESIMAQAEETTEKAQEEKGMKFTKIQAGLYVSANNMMIRKELRNGSWRWLIYDQNRNMLVIMCSLKEAKEWIEQAEAEAHDLEDAKKELQRNLSATLKLREEKRAEWRAKAHAEAIERGAIPNPEKKYHVISWRIGAPVDEKTDCGIWDGSGMAHFSEGFGGFTYSADGWLYFAQEEPAEEIAQADAEESTESNLEAQMSMLEIANVNNLTEFYDSKTDSIRFPDEYFDNTEIFVFRMMREHPDLIMSTAYDFQNARWIHLEKRSQPEKAQEEPQSSDDEITQETSADATEGNSEALNDDDEQAKEEEFQRELAKIKKRREKEIPREMIDAYNRLAEALKGREYYYLLNMYHEFKDVSGKFKSLNHGLIRNHYLEHEGERFFIKKIKHELWLYWEYRGACERWLLNDLSRAYFIKEEA